MRESLSLPNLMCEEHIQSLRSNISSRSAVIELLLRGQPPPLFQFPSVPRDVIPFHQNRQQYRKCANPNQCVCALLIERFIVISVDPRRRNASNLVTHIINTETNRSTPHALAILTQPCNHLRVDVWETRYENIERIPHPIVVIVLYLRQTHQCN